MSFDPVEYIIQQLQEYDSSIDTSPGSAIRDLLVNPLSSMLASFNETHQIFENRLSLANVSGLSEAALDDIAANYLVSRVSGSKAIGYARVYFKEPQNLVIPRYTEFRTAGGLKFFSVAEHTVTATQMLGNADKYPLYHTGSIQLRASEEGASYEVGPLEIVTILNLDATFDSVSNANAFTGGANKDSNTELFQKLIDSANNGSLASTKGIETTLIENFATINNIYIAGASHALMFRDIAQDTTRPDVATYYEADFRGKLLGQDASPYIESKAYYSLLIDEDLTNSGFLSTEFPVPGAFSREFSQEDYSQIFQEDASVTDITPSKVLAYETFEASGYDSSWTLSDERMGLGILVYSGEITIIDSEIHLGNRPSHPGTFLPYQTLVQISGMLDQIVNLA
jgi:hypothetical protein